MDKLQKMKDLVAELNKASYEYYNNDNEIMSNQRFDELYDKLVDLEKETGITLSNSPTSNVGYKAAEFLPQVTHEKPMLSLDKTKDVDALGAFMGEHKTLLSWKLDGLTIVLTYENGNLIQGVTRGNGVVGEDVTNNVRVFKNVPLSIPYKGRLVLRGEAIITYSDFNKINEELDGEALYKNPRNLCSGSVRVLDNRITKTRNITFFAFALVSAETVDFNNSREEQFKWLKSQGFEIVEYRVVTEGTLKEAMEYFIDNVKKNNFPSDGLVALYDDISYGDSLGSTAKFPRNAIAFKWEDEMEETILEDILWSPSRTGLINPIAIFKPVSLEGTTVSRASLHNISICKELMLGIGDKIKVFKANMIIPQVAENLTKSNNFDIPCNCPACNSETIVKKDNATEVLYCPNKNCSAKKIKSFVHFVARNAMNIEGLSEKTLEKFISIGILKEISDIYKIKNYEEKIISLEGFGEKSFKNIVESIEKSKTTTLAHFIYSLGIINVGYSNSRLICDYYNNDLQKILEATPMELSEIEGIGPVIGESIYNFFKDQVNLNLAKNIYNMLILENNNNNKNNQSPNISLNGEVFVITGSLNHYENRDQLKEEILSLGGKVTGSVSKNTTYLINNDVNSTSSKNKKARELGIKIISEEEFLNLIQKE